MRAFLDKIDEIVERLKQQNFKVSCKAHREVYKTHLGLRIYAVIDGKFNGVDLRRYRIPEGQSEMVPTDNGIYLSSTQWPLQQKNSKN